MQKKIFINALISVPANITPEDLMNALRNLGVVESSYSDEYREADAPADQYPEHAWLYVSSDEAAPYLLVRDAGDESGVDLSDEALAGLRENGICTSFYAETPSMDKYGSPGFVNDAYEAGGIMHEHGFTVGTGFGVDYTDRGDDGPANYWLRIALTPAMRAALHSTHPLPAQN